MRWSVLVAAVLGVGCGGDSAPDPSPPPGQAGIVAGGHPIPPRRVSVLGPGWVEMRAGSPAPDGRPAWRVVAMRPPPGRPRDTCVTTGLVAQDLAEADTSCDVSAPGAGVVSFIEEPGIPDRFGRSPTLISGVAPPD